MVGLRKYLKLWLILKLTSQYLVSKFFFSNFTYGCLLFDGLQIFQSTDDLMVAGSRYMSVSFKVGQKTIGAQHYDS